MISLSNIYHVQVKSFLARQKKNNIYIFLRNPRNALDLVLAHLLKMEVVTYLLQNN